MWLQWAVPDGLTPVEAKTLAALIDRIVPEDQDPSAGQSGCAEFIESFFVGDPTFRDLYRAGLLLVDSWSAPSRFVQLSAPEQDEIVERLESTRFGSVLIRHTMEGYYAGPHSRPNQESVGFKVTC